MDDSPLLQVGGEGGGSGLQVCARRQGRLAGLAVHCAGGCCRLCDACAQTPTPSTCPMLACSLAAPLNIYDAATVSVKC